MMTMTKDAPCISYNLATHQHADEQILNSSINLMLLAVGMSF